MSDISSALAAVAMVILPPHLDIPPAEVQPRFDQLCVDGRWHADCPELRRALEIQLLGDLRALYLADAPIDRDVLRTAAKARFSYLAAFALARLQKPESPEDMEAIKVALENPSYSVRSMARAMLNRSGDAYREGIGRWWRIEVETAPPSREVVFATIGVNALDDPQLRYRYSSSMGGRAVFTTKLPPEKVVDLIGKGAPVMTGDKLPRDVSPLTDFTAEPSQVLYVKLVARKNGTMAAIARDDAWGETAVVVTYPWGR